MHYAGDETTTDRDTAPELEEHGDELAEPCDQCGAEAYEACRDHCTALD